MSIKTPLNANGQIEDFIKILHTTTSAQEVNASVNTYLQFPRNRRESKIRR